jgi:uncharacterized protein RhaS with RHS repeats
MNDASGAIVARYEYDPYGNVTAASGPYAAANPFRWGTKYWDDETGFGYCRISGTSYLIPS